LEGSELVVRLGGVKLKDWMRLWRAVWLQKGVSLQGMKLQRGDVEEVKLHGMVKLKRVRLEG
jgi:hypothetical protein